VIIEDWRSDYNANRPHSARGEVTPTEFALPSTTNHQTYRLFAFQFAFVLLRHVLDGLQL
jgi:hypothetical protein